MCRAGIARDRFLGRGFDPGFSFRYDDHVRRLSLSATVFASISVLLAGPLAAQELRAAGSPASRIVPSCTSVAANATFQLEEATTTYQFPPAARSFPCGHFVGDVVVRGDALPPIAQESKINPYGSLAIEMKDVTQAQCPGVEIEVVYYRRPVRGTTFTKIGGGRLVGAWLPFWPGDWNGLVTCQLKPADGYVEADSTTLLNTTAEVYRVAVSASIGGVRKPVRYGVTVIAVPI